MKTSTRDNPARADGRGAVSALVWPFVTMTSLLVGMIALASDPARTGEGPPASRLLLDIPDALATLAVASSALAVMLLLAFALALARRSGKAQEVRRALWGMALLPFVLMIATLWHGGLLERLSLSWSGFDAPGTGPGETDRGSAPPTSVPIFTAAVGALLLGAGLASLGAVGWILFGDRLKRWTARAIAMREPLVGAVEDSLGDLRLEADARRAIIRCYRRFEHALARARLPRAPWQTPLEFMREVLGRLPLPPGAVQQLTGLFELARFSDEPLTPADRDAAWEALLQIRASLPAGEGRGGGGAAARS